ncbi:DNA/RNA polymerase [Mollisia scopiformis]|uniref:DNA/RNA polymerase n=1 Tax=Mollisia scopiformis TaxID=149040 RepID=A0A194XDJ9_MOLSC|nr:DNA/RNA polymerase [Mollisia scopiformis]KUJ18255.1 DNA/RNA polymerase [Mollisia scopiformis]
MLGTKSAKKHDSRIIIHFDYDCFYASVFENENPALKSVPLAVQQKQIIVTCNYEARRRGLGKLQLITEAKKICPDVVIVLGEELGRFRDASKSLYKFLEAFTWSGKVERLGFDEVFMDMTDIVDFNQSLLNPHDLSHSFLQLKRDDPTNGFPFDATRIAGHRHPNISLTSSVTSDGNAEKGLLTRLILGSHLAQHIRWALEEQKGYTSTVGISTNKLISKLVGNLNKPKGQTTLLPPYTLSEEDARAGEESNVTAFLDSHDIGKIPGIGFKMSQRIRNHVLSRPADFDTGLIYGSTRESVTVRDVRLFPGMGPELLEKILGGPGAERGIGGKVWNLINGIDDTEVQQAKKVPTQISIEDSYIRLDTMPEVLKELRILATSLLKRMHTDLLEDDDDPDSVIGKRWIAHPKTVRLSTRPRPPWNADDTRTRSFNRISRSAPLPNFIFSLKEELESLVDKFVQEILVPMFRKLHPSPRGWNLSLVNIGVTNMVETASEDGKSGGRDIGRMFKRQEEVLKEWKVEDKDVPPDLPESDNAVQTDPSAGNQVLESIMTGSEDIIQPTQTSVDEQGVWEDDEDEDEGQEICDECGAIMPAFALAAHERFHSLEG